MSAAARKAAAPVGLPLYGGLYVCPQILLVVDRPDVEDLIDFHLEAAGYRLLRARSVAEAGDALARSVPDLVLFALQAGGAALDWVQQLRTAAATRDVPAMRLARRDAEQDKVQALDAGYDDYVVVPFSPRELLARIGSLLRRRAPRLTDPHLEVDGLVVDHVGGAVSAGATPVPLGPTEFRLLQHLLTHPGRLHTRLSVVRALWGEEAALDPRTVDVYVGRLREALRPTGHHRLVETVRGLGYRVGLGLGKSGSQAVGE